jgi:hypothetical protein
MDKLPEMKGREQMPGLVGMDQAQEKKGMKLWVKILIIVLVVMFLTCGGGFLLLYKMGKNFMRGFTDQETMLKITQSICRIDIPEGYRMNGAFEFAGFKFSMLTYEQNAQEIMLMKIPPSTCSDKELRKSFNNEQFAKQLINQTNRGKRSLEVKNVKSTAKTTINDREFPYALCDMEKDGSPKEGVIGYFNDTAKSGFLIIAYNDPGKYDNDLTVKLLENVK